MPGEIFRNGINSNRSAVYDDHFMERYCRSQLECGSSGCSPPTKETQRAAKKHLQSVHVLPAGYGVVAKIHSLPSR